MPIITAVVVDDTGDIPSISPPLFMYALSFFHIEQVL